MYYNKTQERFFVRRMCFFLRRTAKVSNIKNLEKKKSIWKIWPEKNTILKSTNLIYFYIRISDIIHKHNFIENIWSARISRVVTV